MRRLAPLLVLALPACDLDLARPNREFSLDRVPGAYFAQSELIGLDCPDDAPRLLPSRAPIEVTLDERTLTVTGLPATMTGLIDPGGRFVVEGDHETALGTTTTTMEGAFLAPDDGRGFVARVEEVAPGCRQEYRVRAF